MPIPSTGEIKLNDDVNATLQADTNESNVSLGDNNTVKFTAVGDGSTVSGRSMSELRGQTLFQIFPTTEATGALGKSLHMDGLSSSHNSVKVLEPTLTTAPVFTNTRGTFSFWIKIHETESSKRYLYTSGTADGSLVSILLHSSGTNHKLQVRINSLSNYVTKAIFIDKSGWYNFVVSLDSNVPQDDIKVNCYANGIRLTWEQVANMSDGQAIQFGTNQRINDWAFGDGYGADATYANFIFVDGSALLPNEFGELSNGIWVPKGVNTPSTDTLITTNLIANYQLQGNANDTSVGGTTYNGTASNVTFQQNNYNIASFNGTSSFITLPSTIDEPIRTAAAFAISLWFRRDGNQTDTTYGGRLVHLLDDIYIYINIQTDNTVKAVIVQPGPVYPEAQTPVVADKVWNHLVFTGDSNGIRLYLNSTLVDSDNWNGSFINYTNSNYKFNKLGYTGAGSDNNNVGYLKAHISEVQIYNSAFTDANVLQNYNATKYKYFYGLNGWHLNFNNSDEGSIVSGSVINLDAGDWDADGTDETSFSGTTWSDKSGNNHHAILTNGPTYSGNNEGYFLFDGSDDFATITSNSSFQSLADFSVEMWIYPVTVSNDEMINLLYTSGSNYKWDLRFSSGSSRNFRWTVADSGGNYSSAQDVITNTTTGTVPLNKWSHVTATFSSTNGISRVYINGALTDAKTGTFTTRTNGSENLLLAKRTDGYHANIGIAQSRVYSKALTAQEVVQNFRATQGHYEVLSLADISGNAKGAVANGTNLDGSDHTGDKPDVAFPTFTPEGQMTSEGNVTNGGLTLLDSSNNSNYARFLGPDLPETGKWYWEVEYKGNGGTYLHFTGILNHTFWSSSMTNMRQLTSASNGILGMLDDGRFWDDGTLLLTCTSTNPNGAIVGWAYDADGGTLHIYINGSVQNSGNAVASSISGPKRIFAQNADSNLALNFNFGAKGFSYTPPSGYKALSSDNLPTSTNVDPLNQKKPRDYFESVTYNGTGVRNEIKSLDFQPDFIWIQNIKSTSGYYNALIDSVRGTNSILSSNSTAVEQTSYLDQLESFDANGFSLGNNSGSGNYVNLAGNEYIAWAWKAGGAPTATNTASAGAQPTPGSVMIDGVASTASLAGSLAAEKISANTKSGFSIVKYTGSGTVNQTVYHGLNQAPELIINKQTGGVEDWYVFTTVIDGSNDFIVLNDTALKGNSSLTSPTTDYIYSRTSGTMINYCFHSVEGYSKIGTYTGNGNANGPFVYTGFKPAWLLVKESSASGGFWYIVDNKRNISNTRNLNLFPNATDAESSYGSFDFLSNGFKPANTWGDTNADDQTYIYIAIAEDSAKYAQGTGQTSDTEKFLEKGTGTTQYPANHFKAVAYPGNGATQLIDLNFQPDLVWIKNRSAGHNHVLNDSMRGANKIIYPDITNAQDTAGGPGSAYFNSFNSNGFTVGSSVYYNGSGSNHVAWAWKAGDTQVTKKPTYTSAGILTSNLVLHYNFADSNTYAGTGADLTNIATSSTVSNALQNSPTFVDRSYGNYFDLDGTNDYIRTDWQQNSSTTMTFETWQWVDNDSSYRYIWGDFNTSGTDTTGRFGTRIYNDNQVSVFIGNGTNNNNIASGILDYTPYLEKWTHFVWTINGTTGKLYINGILMSVKTFDYSLTANGTNNMALGNYTGGAITTQTFDGKFGQARIYTAELTQAQIRANYDATRTLYQGVGTTANVLQTGLLNNIDVDSFSSYDPNSFDTTNQVAKFNGSSSKIVVTDSSVSSNTVRSYSAWVKYTGNGYVLANTDGSAYGAHMYIESGTLKGWVYSQAQNAYYCLMQAGGSLTSGQWHHCVMTWGSSASDCRLYLDGVRTETESSLSGSLLSSAAPNELRIGVYTGSGFFTGSIDQVRLFNKVLTDAEVRKLFSETSSTTSTLQVLGDSSCVAAFNLNGNSNNLTGSNNGVNTSITYEFDNTTGYRIKDQTSNNLSLGSLVNTTINEANSWGTSLKYDGSGDYVTLPVGLGRTATQDVTRELWVKIDDLPAGSNSDGLLYIGDMGTSQYYENLRVTSDGTIDYQERPNAGTGGAQDFILSTSSYAGTLSVGVWYHVAYTVQGRLKKIYINGKLVATKTASYDKVNNSTYGGSLGSFKGSSVATTQGEIAQFRSYTSALTDAQIKANYDATKAQFYSALMHSSVSVNEKAGFSIAKHKGDGVLSSRITHGLSSQPDFLVVKNMDTASTSWATWLSVFSSPSETLFLDYAGRSTQYTNRFTNVSETTFQAGNAGSGTAASSEVNKDGSEMIVYAWKSVPGYSKIGRYKGTGSSGHSIEIGFQPSWVMIKNITSTSSTGWLILDAARDSINDNGNAIFASSHIAEWGASNTTINIDFTPTGFEIQNSYVVVNGSSDSYIYMAFA